VGDRHVVELPVSGLDLQHQQLQFIVLLLDLEFVSYMLCLQIGQRALDLCVRALIEEASKRTHLSQPIETSKLPHRHHPLRHRVWRGNDLV
jgi:hypothetical protein